MNLDHWFPTVVGRSEHTEWVDPLVHNFDKLFTNSNTNDNFYYNGRTTYGTRNLAMTPEFSGFMDFIKQKSVDFLEMQGYNTDIINWRPYLFANSFKKGSAHPRHVHTQCSISGIFYLKTPPGSSPIIFYPNQPFKDFFDYMFCRRNDTNWYSMPSKQYDPYPGLLLIWPGWLYHEVPPNNSDEPRTSLVFNL